MKPEEVSEMKCEFRAVLRLILDLLIHGDTERAIAVIREILNE